MQHQQDDKISWAGRFIVFLAAFAPFVVAVSAIIPDLVEYHVSYAQTSKEDVEEWWRDYRSRDEIRDEVRNSRVEVLGEIRGQSAIAAIADMASGRLQLGDSPVISVESPFAVRDIFKGPPSLQLKLAAFAVPDIYLEAFLYTGERSYLQRSLEISEELLDFEASLWLPSGFVWNDHAVAARTFFLTRLIDALMESQLAEPDRVRKLFDALDRSVRLLAKPTQFTYRTNHGIIQSLAILHVALFSPELPAISEVLEEVIGRLQRQMEFFVSNDGIVLEHSAEYQEFGTQLVDTLARYYRLLNYNVPSNWDAKLENAKQLLAHLRRPDGSLPRYGDTNGLPKSALESALVREDGLWMSEAFGYWSSWFVPDAHLLATWSNFVSGAHKHADELSLIFWSQGEEWWTASGYWPYGYSHREEAVGWSGNNAPHEYGEPYSSERQSRLVRWASSDHAELIHLRRWRPDGYQLDRVIVTDKAGAWFVFDMPSGGDKTTVSEWRTMHTVSVSPESDSEFLMSSSRSEEVISVNVRGGASVSIDWVKGQKDSALGWLGLKSRLIRTNTMTVETPPDTWSLIAWRGGRGDAANNFVSSVEWNGSSDWALNYMDGHERISIEYSSDELVVKGRSPTPYTARLVAGKTNIPELAKTESKYLLMEEEYDRYRDLLPWRVRAMKILTIAATLQAIFLLGLGLTRKPRALPLGAAFLLVAWMIGGTWLHMSYFKT